MVHGLDIVAIGIEQEGGVVARMIGALAGPAVARFKRPLAIFGVAEILIGLSALATPLALDAASALYQRLHQLNPDSLTLLTLARFAVSFAVLLLPTVLMGLTLPVLSASALVRGARFGSRLSALYAVNTAGAAYLMKPDCASVRRIYPPPAARSSPRSFLSRK